MQQVLIKKFSLRRNGVVYKAGTIIERRIAKLMF